MPNKHVIRAAPGGGKFVKRARKKKTVEPRTTLADVYDGQLDDVVAAYQNIPPVIAKAKPPNGCVWRVERSESEIIVAAVKEDGEILMQISGEYHNTKTRLWRDPQEVAERLAQVVLFGAVFEKISANKTKTKPRPVV
jgi:hypothetical protein